MLTRPIDQEEHVKSDEEIMEILEAFDLTRSYRAAAELAGCSHHTVKDWVRKRDAGRPRLPECAEADSLGASMVVGWRRWAR